MKKFDLSGKTAIITGGAGLLGRQHAEALAGAGANCILIDVDTGLLAESVKSIQASCPNVRIIGKTVDITSIDELEALQKESYKELGKINILINNAAMNPKMSTTDDLKENSRFENFILEQWDKEIAVGLTGAFLCCQVFGAEMAKGGGGVILNIASDLGVIAPDQRIYRQEGIAPEMQPVKPVTYSVIKHGLLGLTKYLATYWAEKNIRVNSLSPGGVYNNQPDAFVKKLTNLIPMGRMAEKDEYQAAVLFLVSDASSYMTGINLVIDGGRTVW
ncbi:MAG: SDR family oxidoreductase [Syntrophomonadaceae bacterium]|nr:SDR family oxidoreductase [Syntrophomonadaceae bacterium]